MAVRMEVPCSSRIFFLVSFCAICLFSVGFGEFVVELKSDNFKEFIASPVIRLVYFRRLGAERELPKLLGFYKQYELAGEALSSYKVKLGKVDCTKENIGEYCSKGAILQNVYAFRNGHELLEMELDTMFDVNSITANALQLVLLKEVPIVQNKMEERKLEQKYKGTHDIVFSYQRAVGTEAHRYFMEVAYAFSEEFKFALTTDIETCVDFEDVEEVNKQETLWILRCKEAKVEERCVSVRYKDQFELVSLYSFFKGLRLPATHDVQPGPFKTPYDDAGMHVVYLFYNKEHEEKAKALAKQLGEKYLGVVGIITINVDKIAKKDLESVNIFTGSHTTPPALGMRLRHQDASTSYMGTTFTDYDLETASSYIDAELRSTRTQKDEEDMSEDIQEDPELQDDSVADAVYQMRNAPINMTMIPALTDKTFFTETKERDILAVLYYYSVDAISMAFLRSYAEASLTTYKDPASSPLARVECFDWTDVCAKEKVTKFPVVRIFRKDQKPYEYKGLLDGSSVIKTLNMLRMPNPVILKDKSETENFASAKYDLGMPVTEFVLGSFKSSDKKELNAFKDAATSLHGQIVFGMAIDNAVMEEFSPTPSIVVIKTADPYQPKVTFSGAYTPEGIVEFVKKAKLPRVPQLTPETLPTYYSKNLPFVLLFGYPGKESDEILQAFSEIVASGQFKDHIFAWLDMSGNSLASDILSEYSPNTDIPAVVHLDRKGGNVHVCDSEEMGSKESIVKWLGKVKEGKKDPTKTLPKEEWKPRLPGFNFINKTAIEEEDEGDEPDDLAPRDEDEEEMGMSDKVSLGSDEVQDSDLDSDDEGEGRGKKKEMDMGRLYSHIKKSDRGHKTRRDEL